MKYTKPAKTFEEQADLLIKRGLIADKDKLIRKLRSVNYYRLSGYLFPFRDRNDKFKEGTTFEEIWRIYDFDRKLRLLVFDAIERIEVKARTLSAYYIAHNNGSFEYTKKSLFPRLKNEKFPKWMKSIEDEYKRSNEVFVKHFKNKYGNEHVLPPIWVAVETMSFGDIVRIFRSYDSSLTREWSNEIQIPDKVLESWLLSLNYVRNICAHHSRLWNRELSVKPLLPNSRKYKKWDVVNYDAQKKIFSIIAICFYFLKTLAPKSKWKERLFSLIDEYSDINILEMGFPENWKEFFVVD